MFSPEFRERLRLGKYSRWAVNLTEAQLEAIIWMIGEFGYRASCVLPLLSGHWGREGEGRAAEAEFFQWYNCETEGRVWRVVSAPELYNASWLRLGEFDAADASWLGIEQVARELPHHPDGGLPVSRGAWPRACKAGDLVRLK